MIDLGGFRDLAPKTPTVSYTADHVFAGIPVPKTRRIGLFSPDDWEEFTEEWASSLTPAYYHVARIAGPKDKGLDVVGFISDHTFDGGWDNYQCKHYDDPLKPSDIWGEIGKILFYSYSGEYPPPRKYYFVCPKGIGTTLARLIANPIKLKSEAKKIGRNTAKTGFHPFLVPHCKEIWRHISMDSIFPFSRRRRSSNL
jgi:hypothetical protein